MKHLTLVVAWTLYCIVPSARASLDTLGPNGINATGLTLPDVGLTPLTGDGITVGQIEDSRPGKFGFDANANANQFVDPTVVYDQYGDPPDVDTHVSDHATEVASVIVSTDATDSNSNGDAPLGVAPNANLRAAPYVTAGVDPGYRDVLLTTQFLSTLFGPTSTSRTRVINHSWLKEQSPIGPLDGTTLLTLGMDWLSRKHDVLNIVAGPQGESATPIPSDHYNGITVAYSQKKDGVFRQYGELNDPFSDASGLRTSIDILAPGFEVELATLADGEVTKTGTSFAAPQVTGTVALLQEYADFRIAEGALNSWLLTDGRRHEVIKAVILNSADKIQDTGNGKYLGMDRTVLKQDGTSTWLDSSAYSNQNIVFDEELGAGHLNALRALAQFAPGQYASSDTADRPQIAWDKGFTRDDGQINRYRMGEIAEGVFISVTLTWDRVVNFFNDFDEQDVYDNQFDSFTSPGATNLDLYLLPQGSTSKDDAIWASNATDGTVEHMFFEIPSTGDYEFWVYQEGAKVIPDDVPVSQHLSYNQQYGVAWWTASALTLTSDFDGDGDVDAMDLSQWQGDYGLNGDSDANGDGLTTGADFLAWQREFGMSNTSSTALGVPEPPGHVLSVIALVAASVVAVRRI
ncbi:MAG: hypothetical protein CMJ58_12500 [Planctomycetaceae bacterium]|nr:hypothetical protein [Planctomycetaceae bacterium]